MTVKLIVLVSLAVIASSTLDAQVISSDHIIPILPATVIPQVLLKADEADKNAQDPDITFAYDTHKAVMEAQYIKPPYHYSYGYEIHNATTNVTKSQYESRYGDVATGIYIIRASDGSRSIVDYTLDTTNVFHAVLRKDVQGRAVNFGYARIAGPLAYASHPTPEEYASRTTILADPAASEEALVKSAYRTHRIIVKFHDVSAPFDMSWGYEVTDPVAGRRSQYQTYQGDAGEGSYVEVGLDGTSRTQIDYVISPKGFAFTSPETFA